ncbi:amino acid adenylation domain-containing protein [Phytohabitans kaempferiae]|uniref:Amino acid adenylation domain-containing protein n=1 Tax=Phytohabitans kaempferiae TaxID=1620943 RepID=A0ABV6LYS1_9ACTN
MVDIAVPRPAHATALLHEVTAGHDADRLALRFRGRAAEELTYGELERRANRLAHALNRAGVGAGHVVGLLLERGPHLPVAQLAVMKAGAAWTPLDPRYPAARLAFQVGDAAAPLVLTTTDLAELAGHAPAGTPHWCLDEPAHAARLEGCPETAPANDVRPDDPAYLMYTSGSTGTPKGVLVSHRSAYAFCRAAADVFALGPADRVGQLANPAFDGSVFDCFATLLAGATMVSAPHETIADPAAYTALLRAERVTFSFVPPAILALLDPDALAGSDLRILYSGGETLGAEQVGRWSRPGLELHNTYGPTETTVFCTHHVCPAGPLAAPPPIGAPLAHQRAYVLDQRLRPVPVGVPGQLFVAGTGVAHGYHNRPGLTAQRFLPDPYGEPGRRMYATGDLARWRSDGVLEYLGRIDRQVKLRGQRIELGEIEHALTQHPGVRQCAVVLRDGSYLAAYVVGDAGPAEIRTHLAERLPTYMLPAAYVTLPELPLNPNGKVDTARLPDPRPAAVEYREPRTDTERWLADTWRDLLGVDRVGTGDTFFDLGANSLHTTQLTARTRNHLEVQLDPRDLFANPTLEQLATRIDEARATTAGDPPPDAPEEELDDEIAALERMLAEKRAAKARRAQAQRPRAVSRDGKLPCTLQQEGLWFVQQMDRSSPVYHIGFGLRLRGVPVRAALEGALHALVLRHEALRTRFVADDGVPRQVVDPAPDTPPPLSTVDLDGADVERWVADEIARPMDLAAGPLFRAALGRVAPDDHVLALVVHHIVADGWSVGLLAGELSLLYGAAVRGVDPGLPELSTQPADHAAWQRGWLDGAELSRQLGYWRTALADLPTVDFPTDRPRPAQPTGAGANRQRRLPGALSTVASAYARTHRVSFLAVVQAALLTVLHRYTGQTDLPIGSIFSGRTRAEIEPLVGFFANTLVLRTDVGGDPSFAEVVRRCHHSVLDATVHQDVPFGLVVETLQPERTAGRNPLFQISLTLQPGRGGGGEGRLDLGGLTTESVNVPTGYARFDLGIDLAESPDGTLELAVEYSTELFDADRIDRLTDHLLAALAAGLAAPETAIAEIDLLSPAERERVLRTWNPPPVPRDTGLLHEMPGRHDPDRPAVRFGDAELTYGDLERRANRLARALLDAGAGTGRIVALLLERGPHLPVAQLAVLKAGAAWTMLDPQLPAARLAFQVADAAAALVLATTDLAELAPDGPPLWRLDEMDLAGPETPPEVEVRPDDPAYLLYTSGSTGRPKGVMVTHRSVYAYCQNAVEIFDMTPDDRVVQVSNPAFDASIFEIYAVWLAGATLVGTARETVTDPEAFTALLHAEAVTLAYLPPAILGLLDPARLTGSALRGAFSAGEALPTEQANRWYRPGFAMHNSYGPTETTVICTNYPLPDTPLLSPPPIGAPLPNHRTYVLDKRLQPVPIGVPGHLYVGGSGVTLGYLNRPALTAQSFLADPYGGAPGERMYGTGDLVRWRSDGLIEFLGRIDRQVKIRGQRVELGEIEYALVRHPRIRQSAVVLRGSTLAGYIVGDADLDELRRFLTERLPTYMIPTALVPLAELPITPNGKLDTARLPDPGSVAADYVAPRTGTERWLATAWQDLLDTDQIGATDNFFDLGGNSLHATRLTARVRDQLGVEFHPQHLFTNPTLEDLAARLDQIRDDGDTRSDTGVVTLRASGTRPPLFLVHPVGGAVTPYAQLAPMLGDDLPVHAIEDPGLRGAVPEGGLVERARQYVELVRRLRPDGPYHLGGWSIGGIIGLEMARQLTEAGARVDLVVAIDSGLPRQREEVGDVDALVGFVRDLAGRAGITAPDLDAETYGRLDREALEERVLDVLDKAGLAPSGLRDEMRVRMRVYVANMRALHAHEPRAYGGRFVLVRAAECLAPAEFERWPAVSPDIEYRTAPGNHFTMVQPPHLTGLAAVLRDVLSGTGDR